MRMNSNSREAAEQFGGSAPLDIPPKLGELERRLTLAKLVAAWANQLQPDSPMDAPLVVGGPASTLALANDLARLMDDMAIRGVDWKALDGLVPDALDQYWQITLRFPENCAQNVARASRSKSKGSNPRRGATC